MQTNGSAPCRNGCGFFGTAARDGMCSSCWAKANKSDLSNEYGDDRLGVSNARPIPIASPAKDSSHRRSNSLGDQAGSPGKKSQEISTTWKGLRQGMETLLNKGLDRVMPHHDIDFLKEIHAPAAMEMANIIKGFVRKLEAEEARSYTVDQLTAAVYDFYKDVDDCMNTSKAWEGVPEDIREQVMSGSERHVMSHCYDRFFRANLEDEETDLALQQRIRSLRWVTPQHLEACFVGEDPAVRQSFETAQEQLIMIDAMRAPEDKLACIVECSKAVFNVLDFSSKDMGNRASADDFLPVLIYVVLKANPPLLHSNLQFISRFCNPTRLQSGEAGYYYTNLFGAASFIEKLNHSHLKISEDEFRRRMNGDLAPHGIPVMANRSRMRTLLERTRHLAMRQKVLQEDMMSLHDAISRMCASAVMPTPKSSRPDAKMSKRSQSVPSSPSLGRK